MDHQRAVLRLIAQVIHVSLETMKLVKSLPTLGLEPATKSAAQ
jgi:hypothetical protein